LLGNGSLSTFRGNGKTEKHELFEVVISHQFAQSCKRHFIRELIDSLRESKDTFVGELSVQLWNVYQRTMEAEEVTDS
jgi:hypothetical protein